MAQSPKRRETDEQAEERVRKITEYNEAYGCDVHGRPITKEGNLLRNLTKKEWDVFKLFRS